MGKHCCVHIYLYGFIIDFYFIYTFKQIRKYLKCISKKLVTRARKYYIYLIYLRLQQNGKSLYLSIKMITDQCVMLLIN